MTCNKKYFRDKKTAKNKKKQLEQLYGKKYEVYRCNDCKQIHLTSKKTVGEKQFFRNNLKVNKNRV